MRLSVLAIAMFVMSVTVGEIITTELPNILDWNLWSWKWRSMTSTICMKIDWRTYLVSMHTCAKVDASRSSHCSQYKIVHFVINARTHARTQYAPRLLPGCRSEFIERLVGSYSVVGHPDQLPLTLKTNFCKITYNQPQTTYPAPPTHSLDESYFLGAVKQRAW